MTIPAVPVKQPIKARARGQVQARLIQRARRQVGPVLPLDGREMRAMRGLQEQGMAEPCIGFPGHWWVSV